MPICYERKGENNMARQMKKVASNTANTNDSVTEDDVVNTNDSKKVSFSDHDYILCHSIIAGGLHINCRSGNFYYFKKYGSEQEIEYRDLVELIRKHSDHIFVPRIIIDDPDFVDQMPMVKNFYDSMYTVNDLREIIGLPEDDLRKAVAGMPNEIKSTMKSLAATMIDTGEIDSIKRVHLLTEVFDTDFVFLSELLSKG